MAKDAPIAHKKNLWKFEVSVKKALFVSDVANGICQHNNDNSKGLGPHAI